MNKTELIAAAAEGAGLTKKDTERVINAAIDAVTAALVKGDKVQVSGFGTFETKEREARVGRNPHTKEAIEIPATRVPAFKASKALKDNVGPMFSSPATWKTTTPSRRSPRVRPWLAPSSAWMTRASPSSAEATFPLLPPQVWAANRVRRYIHYDHHPAGP